MLKLTKSAITFSLVVILLCACGRFNGDIRFKNISQQDIVVGNVHGFSHEPPVGYLISNSSAESSMASMEFPEEIIIEWWHMPKEDKYESDGDIFNTKVSLKNIKPPYGREEIIFTFINQEEWVVEVK